MSALTRVAAALLVALSLAGCAMEGSGEEARFRQACTTAGGFVAQTSSGFWVSHIDCIKDNRLLYLPGFA